MPLSQSQALRRSSRVPARVPVHVTSLAPDTRFSGVCETLVVSAHGCAIQLPVQLDEGSPLHLHSREGRQATAYVVDCEPLGSDGEGWRLGARLEQPENFWGLKSFPEDWRVLEMPASLTRQSSPKLTAAPVVLKKAQPSRPSQAILDKIEEQLSEDRLRGILATFVRPLQSEVVELREKLARHARQNRFEVSLGQIPPELEQKLWERLRQEVGGKVVEQTREQSAEILASSKSASEQKIAAALTEFRHRLSGELHTVEQRAQALAKELTTTTRHQVQAGIEKLQQQALDAGAQLNAEGEKITGGLERRLVETSAARQRDLEKTQAEAAEKASQLQFEVTALGRRLGTLNDSVRRLESDLDAHLERIATEIVNDAQSKLESAVANALKDFQTRGANETDVRLDEVCGHLRTIQNRIEASFSGSVKTQSDEALQSIEQQFTEIARQSIERWRIALAKDLSSFANTLGQNLRRESPAPEA